MRPRQLSLLLAALLLSHLPTWAALSCNKLSFLAQVKRGEHFSKDIGMGLQFRMEPQPDDWGWTFEIGAADAKADEFNSYVYAVTIPWRSRHTTNLGLGYGTLAQDATDSIPHHFWTVLSPDDGRRAAHFLDEVLWPQNSEVHQTALRALKTLPKGSGKLTVLRSAIRPGRPGADQLFELGDYGAIYAIAVSVELTVPHDFRPAPRIKVRSAKCADQSGWPYGPK